MSRIARGLDLFCGAGGATAGYMRGFGPGEVHMTGIDKWFMRNYIGDDFIQEDALVVLQHWTEWVRSFDFIHLSPPCQLFSPTRTLNPGASHRRVDALTPALALIKQYYPDKLVVIENVPEAPMYSRIHQILRLCASSFPGHHGFDPRRLLHRHRHFRLHNFRVPRLACNHNGYKPLGVYGSINSQVPGGGEIAQNLREAQVLMQIDWMPWRELKEAIPPAFTEYVTTGGLHEAVRQLESA